ncbi:MAG TPA: hypothetical protein DCQ06_03440 [Myxococcales bacterium]|nr:hypothetical protein [Myxococcales bacterium]
MVQVCEQLRPPTSVTATADWLSSKGCPGASSDGSAALCWHSTQRDGTTRLQLVEWLAPGRQKTSWQVYEGPSQWTPSALAPTALAKACAWLRDKDFSAGEVTELPVKITHNQLTVVWGPRHWKMALQKPPTMAPTVKLAGREVLCCRPKPNQASYFEPQGLLVVQLHYTCSWHRQPQSVDDLCADPKWDGKGSSQQARSTYFLPVGPKP